MEIFEPKFNTPAGGSAEKEEKAKDERLMIRESEISEQFSRSGGKGGQNVNKRSTKSEVRWNVDETKDFTPDEKEKIKRILGNRITKEGDLVVTSQEERTQFQNRQRAIERLNDLVRTALEPEKERIPTKPTAGSKERRLGEKKHRGEKKKWRAEKAEY